MRKILLIHILFFTTHFYAQSNTDCFSIEPGQVIEVPENAQVGDTIATIQYCSSGEWKKLEAEFFSTLALKENGQLYTWGINGEGGSWPPITAGADPNQQIIFDPYFSVLSLLRFVVDFGRKWCTVVKAWLKLRIILMIQYVTD